MRRRKHFPYPLLPPATCHQSPATCQLSPATCHTPPVTRHPRRKTPRFLRRRCTKAVPGRKRYHFLRGLGHQPPPKQENTSYPAQKVPRSGFGQKKVSFPAQNGIPPASRAEKRLISRAEGASEAFQAEKGIFSCAERDTTHLPSRKTPQFRRRRLLTPSTSPPSTTFFLFLAILLFLRKTLRINLPDRFIKPFEFHRFAGYILLTGKNCSGNKIFWPTAKFPQNKKLWNTDKLTGKWSSFGSPG